MQTRTQDIMHYQFIKTLQALPCVEALWLFGSRARGDALARADVDLAVLCPRATSKDWRHIVAITLQADTLLKIDCVRFDALAWDDPLRANILQHKQVLYAKSSAPLVWKDYFLSWGRAIQRFAELMRHPDLRTHDYMQDAAIQRFEFVTELSWKVLKKILQYEKIPTTTPRDVISQAYQFSLIDEEAMWLRMLDDRNLTSHVYKQEDAQRVFEHLSDYYPVLEATHRQLSQQYPI